MVKARLDVLTFANFDTSYWYRRPNCELGWCIFISYDIMFDLKSFKGLCNMIKNMNKNTVRQWFTVWLSNIFYITELSMLLILKQVSLVRSKFWTKNRSKSLIWGTRSRRKSALWKWSRHKTAPEPWGIECKGQICQTWLTTASSPHTCPLAQHMKGGLVVLFF